MNFELTNFMRRQYDEDGFFVTETVFDPTLIQTLEKEFYRVWNEQIEATQGSDPQTLLRLRERPFISGLDKKSRPCAEFLRHPVFLDLCRQMIGADADVPWPQAVIKPPSKDFDNAFAWHQDNFYAGHGSHVSQWNRERLLDLSNGFMCWVAITRTTIQNGTLWVVPRQHRKGFLLHIRDAQRAEWVCQFDETGKRAVELQPGQMIVFSGLTPHCSGPNTSTETRMAYQFGFVRPDTTTVPTCVTVMRHDQPVYS